MLIFLHQKVKDTALEDNNEYLFDKVNEYAEAAGEDKHIEFYKMLLGYFE